MSGDWQAALLFGIAAIVYLGWWLGSGPVTRGGGGRYVPPEPMSRPAPCPFGCACETCRYKSEPYR